MMMERKPNVIYILADDMGYGDVSALNENCAFKTPNFDEMAEHGVAFTDAHATSAVCTPSRFSLLTGKYAWRRHSHGALQLAFPPQVRRHERLFQPPD